MAVYRRGYQRYEGPRTGRFTRLMVLPKYAWHNLLKKRLMLSLLIMSMFWPIICIGFIYFSNNLDMLLDISPGLTSFLEIDSRFFMIFIKVQGAFSILIAVFAGPGLVAPDLSNNALQLYFSRSFTRTEYVLSRMMVLFGALSIVTWVPGLLLFFIQAALADSSWLIENWNLGSGVFFGLLLWIILLSLVAMAGSAYVRKRVMAEALILAVIFILPAITKILNQAFKISWASLFNPLHVMASICDWLLGTVPDHGPSVFNCWLALFFMIALLIMILRRKLRPVEVVS